MVVYLAGGGVKKELSPMNIYLVNPSTRPFVIQGGDDNIPCRRTSSEEWLTSHTEGGLNILESFYYVRTNKYFPKLYPYFDNFMLDSGAFTFMQGKGTGIDWMKYTEDYAEFINRYDIKLFFELDIDKIIGLRNVEVLRERLEQLTGKKPIPVWHETRNKEYWTNMCREYPYVAVGGLALSKGNKKKELENYLPYFIDSAHRNGAKIHGLGYTSIGNLKYLHFDSVDSKAWLHGNIGGWLYKFNATTGTMDKWMQNNKGRMKSREGAIHNFNEWIKFSNYAKIYL